MPIVLPPCYIVCSPGENLSQGVLVIIVVYRTVIYNYTHLVRPLPKVGFYFVQYIFSTALHATYMSSTSNAIESVGRPKELLIAKVKVPLMVIDCPSILVQQVIVDERLGIYGICTFPFTAISSLESLNLGILFYTLLPRIAC